MSFLITRHIWDHSPQKGNAKFVLLALADFANKRGLAWPSIQTLATKTGISGRQIKRILPKLEEAGEIHIERSGPGRRRVHHYTFPKYMNGDTLSPFPKGSTYKKGDNLSKNGDTLSPDPIRTKKKREIVFSSREQKMENPKPKPRLGKGVVL